MNSLSYIPNQLLTASYPAPGQTSSEMLGTPGAESFTYTTSALEALLPSVGASNMLRWNYTWEPGQNAQHGLGQAVHLTYSFPTARPDYYSASEMLNFSAFSNAQKTAVRSILDSLSEIANITFSEVAGVGEILFANSVFGTDMTTGGYAYYPSPWNNGVDGDIILNSNCDWDAAWGNGWNPGPGGDAYATLLHELGHALGLKHPHEETYRLVPELDTESHTVMTYNLAALPAAIKMQGANYCYYNFLRSSTFMLLDVEALQYLYGANTSTRTENDTYSWGVNPVISETIWDAGGVDVLDCSNQTRRCDINLQDGSFSSIGLAQTDAEIRATFGAANWVSLPDNVYTGKNNIAIAKGAIIENAFGGSGNDTLTGNAVNNILDGGAGADLITGGAGNDTLYGGAGNDTLRGGNGDDYIDGGAGTDYLYGGAGNDSLEGGAGNDRLYGDAGNDTLRGGAGIDQLYGGDGKDYLNGGAGADVMVGGLGDDTYVVDNTGDQVREDAGAGTDKVRSSIDYTLPDNVEDLELVGTGDSNGYGNSLGNVITGTDGANNLYGRAGNDRLEGDVGSDKLYGQAGNDTLIGGADRDYLWGGDGNDYLSGGPGNDVLYGEAGTDTLIGGAGVDKLTGGAGADKLTGGDGADVFIYTQVADSALTDRDRIYDFVRGVDKLDFSGFDANTVANGVQHFNFINASSFTAAGQLLFSYNAGTDTGIVYGNVDNDTKADFAIYLSGVTALTDADFVLA